MGKQHIWTAVCVTAASAILFASGCSRGGYEDGTGFSDGFIAGYGRACQISSPAENRRWQNADYSRGYADGVEKGIQACSEERRESRYIASLAPQHGIGAAP